MMKKNRFATLLAGALLLHGAAFAQTDIRQGLVAYWPLDEVNSGFTPDLVNGADMELFSMDETSLVDGHKSKALSFDGISQYAAYVRYDGDPAAMPPVYRSAKFTISMWVKGVGTGQSDRRFFSESSSLNNTPLFNLGTDSGGATNRISAYIRTDGNTAVANHINSQSMPLDGQWHHIAWVDDNGNATLYVDGVPDATSFKYTRGTLTLDTTAIGAIVRAAPSSFFAGSIDDVAIWERTLTPAEIQNVFTNGLQTPIPDLPALITLQPLPATRPLGDKVVFKIETVGERPFTFQWLKDGTPITDATSNSLAIYNLKPSDAGSYSVRVTNIGGTTTSDAVQLTVTDDPAPDTRQGLISYWPLNQGGTNTPDIYSHNDFLLNAMDESNVIPAKIGNGLTFDGVEEYGYNSTASPIYNSTNYSIAFWVKGEYTGQSDLRVFAQGSATSNNPLVTFGTDNTGATPSLNVYIRNNDGSIPVNARKSTRPVFDNEWHHVVWTDNNGSARLFIDGVIDETDFSYTRGLLTPTTTSIGGILRAGPSHFCLCTLDDVAVWNRSLTYSEIQSILAEGIQPPLAAIPPSITLQPLGATAYQGDRIVLSANGSGTSPLSFQWLKDGAPIDGATNRLLNLSNIQPGAAGGYAFRVTNSAGSITSDAAQISVRPVAGVRTALVAYWPFETAGTTTPDVVNGNDLTLNNMDASNIVPGKTGNALTFDGVEEYLSRMDTNSNGLPITSNPAFTVAFWVNAFGTGQSDRRLFSEGSTLDNNPLFNIGTASDGASDLIDMFIRYDANTGNPLNHVRSTTPALDGNWHHVAWTDNNGAATLFIDGYPDATGFNYARGPLTANVTSFGAIVRAAAGNFFAGTMDEVALWSRALSQDEILQVMTNGPTSGSTGGTSLHIASIAKTSSGKLHLLVDTDAPSATHQVQFTAEIANPSWTDLAGVAWTQTNGQAIAEFDAPATGHGFYRISAAGGTPAPSPIFSDSFETVVPSWTHGGIGDSWQMGPPSVGPGVAFSGTQVWAVGLDQAYAPDTMQWLRSPVIDLTGVTSARLSYYEYRDFEANTGDSTTVNIKDAADPENGFIAQLATDYTPASGWVLRSFPLPPEALGKKVVIEFLFTSDSSNVIPRSGWFIDDVTVKK
jgi:hypothetical protein